MILFVVCLSFAINLGLGPKVDLFRRFSSVLGLLMMSTNSCVHSACCLNTMSKRPVPPKYRGFAILCWAIVWIFSFHRKLKIWDCSFFCVSLGISMCLILNSIKYPVQTSRQRCASNNLSRDNENLLLVAAFYTPISSFWEGPLQNSVPLSNFPTHL